MLEIRKEIARRKRKEAKRIRDAKARTETMKAIKPAPEPLYPMPLRLIQRFRRGKLSVGKRGLCATLIPTDP